MSDAASSSPSASDPTVLRGDPAPSVPQASPAPTEGRSFGRYTLIEELGHGGMGVVWKAFDTQLRRVVALKAMIAEEFAGEDQIERFMREARSAARLSHPNIVSVYDVGEQDGKHYFTCEYVEGRPLDAVMGTAVPVRQAVGWVKGVAEALQFAHVQGIVHRDVKPGNVLIDKEGRPHVMDFGLAKHVERKEGPTLTLSGDLLGTPKYMSPEQTRGAMEVGPASDQFSLGVVLYELLAWRAPFDGVDMRSLLNAIAEEDPVRPSVHNPRAHRDLETICLKALEKDPARRYAAIGDFAADLGRWLDGEPIEARPVSVVGRLVRRAAKRKWIVALSGAVLLLAALAARFAVYARAESHKVETAQESEAQARARLEKALAASAVFARWMNLDGALGPIDATVRSTRLSDEEKAKVIGRHWAQVEWFVRGTPNDPASQTTMEALLGWAHWVAGRRQEGLERMRESARSDPDLPYGSLFEAFAVLGELLERRPVIHPMYRQGATEAFIDDADVRGQEEAWQRIDLLLARTRDSKAWGKEQADAFADVIEGMKAMRSKDFARADRALTRAIESLNWPYLGGMIIDARAQAREYLEDFDGAAQDAEALVSAYPDLEAAHLRMGNVLHAHALAQQKRGEDPRPLLEQALAVYEETVALSPRMAAAWCDLGVARQDLARVVFDRGGEAASMVGGAVEAFSQAASIEPANWIHALDRGGALALKGTIEAAGGADPRPSYDQAIEDFGRAIELAPRSAIPWSQRARAWEQRGEAEAARGIDPRPSYAKAIADCDEALSRDRGLSEAWDIRGSTGTRTGEAEAARGIDPRATFDRAIEDLGEAVRLAPDDLGARHPRAMAYESRAEAEQARGGNPMPFLTKAVEELDVILHRNPIYLVALNSRGCTRQAIGDVERAAGRDGSKDYEAAIVDFGRALDRKPDYVEALNNRAVAWRCLGKARRAKGEDAEPCLRHGIEDLDRILALNPALAAVYQNRANLWRDLGEIQAARGEEARPSYEAAIAGYGEAISRNASLAIAFECRGEVRYALAALLNGQGDGARTVMEAAVADFEQAASIDRSSWSSLKNEGAALEALDRPREAVAAYTRALEIVGDGCPELRTDLARARRAAEGR